MNKKSIITALLILIALFTISKKVDPLKLKYEKLNNNKNIKVIIPNNNPVRNTNYTEIKKILKKTGIIFVGSPKNEASRNSINILLQAAEETGVEKISYIDIHEITDNKLSDKIDEKIKVPLLIIIKNGKIIDIINESSKTINKQKNKEIKKKYIDAISKTMTCSINKNEC